MDSGRGITGGGSGYAALLAHAATVPVTQCNGLCHVTAFLQSSAHGHIQTQGTSALDKHQPNGLQEKVQSRADNLTYREISEARAGCLC
jgi:hypothetical protein